MANKFFIKKKQAAVLKHAILGRYVRAYVSKTGSRGPDVAYIDGYAGPGSYDDGAEGSPAIAIKTAKTLGNDNLAESRIDGYFIEDEPASCQALRDYFAAEGCNWHVFEGRAEDHVPEILTRLTPDQPSFWFLDPFGLGIPFTLLQQILERSGPVTQGRRHRGAATEVLLNFSIKGLYRNAGHLTSTSDDAQYSQKTKQTLTARVDASMGGTWWQEVWLNTPSHQREDAVLAGYLDRLDSIGWSARVIPVANEWQGRPIYHLILMTRHPDGLWLFNDIVSKAMEEMRQDFYDSEGLLDFEPLPTREAQWVASIRTNITAQLAQGAFTVGQHAEEVYGDTIGLARETHVRTAIKDLFKAGLTGCDGKGTVRQLRVGPP